MKTIIYANHGMRGAEKRTVYTTSPAEIYDRLEVEIPDDIYYGKNEYEEILLKMDGTVYLLSEVLCGDEFPHIMVPGDKTKYKMLKVTNYNA